VITFSCALGSQLTGNSNRERGAIRYSYKLCMSMMPFDSRVISYNKRTLAAGSDSDPTVWTCASPVRLRGSNGLSAGLHEQENKNLK
jgi:hypothetical protein